MLLLQTARVCIRLHGLRKAAISAMPDYDSLAERTKGRSYIVGRSEKALASIGLRSHKAETTNRSLRKRDSQELRNAGSVRCTVTLNQAIGGLYPMRGAVEIPGGSIRPARDQEAGA